MFEAINSILHFTFRGVTTAVCLISHIMAHCAPTFLSVHCSADQDGTKEGSIAAYNIIEGNIVAIQQPETTQVVSFFFTLLRSLLLSVGIRTREFGAMWTKF